jgi:hypothetical protein
MISTCANPACKKPFHYLRGGRLYRFDSPCPGAHSDDVGNAVYKTKPGRCAVFFWLCSKCAATLSLQFDGRQISVMPLKAPFRGNARHPVVETGEWKINHDPAAADPNASSVGSMATQAAMNTR